MSKVWNLSSSLYVFLKSPLPNHKVHCYYTIFAKLILAIWEVHITLLSPLCSNLQSLVTNSTRPNRQVHLTLWAASSWPNILNFLSCPLPEFVSGLPIGLPPKNLFLLSLSLFDSPFKIERSPFKNKNCLYLFILNILRAKGIHENSGYLKMK